MSFSLALLINIVLIVVVAGWLRRVVIHQVDPNRLLDNISQEVRSVIAELNQAADNSVTLLEDRVRVLNQRLRVADQRIEELEELLEYSRRVASDRRSEKETHKAESRETGEPVEKNSQVQIDHRSSGTPGNTAANGSTIGTDSVGKENPDHVAAPTEQIEASKDETSRVLALYQSGLSSDAIATRTGVAIGEVELIISLRERRSVR